MKSLKTLRKKIDSIDSKISKLLDKRASEVLKIKSLKKLYEIKITDKTREKEILAKYDNPYQKEIFKKIISCSRRLQRPTLE